MKHSSPLLPYEGKKITHAFEIRKIDTINGLNIHDQSSFVMRKCGHHIQGPGFN